MHDNEKHYHVIISAGTIVKTLVILILAYFLFLIRDLVLVILTAVVIASAVEPMTAWLEKKRIPRTLGVLLLYVVGLVILFGVVYSIFPILLTEFSGLAALVPQYLSSLVDPSIVNGFTDSNIFANLNLTDLFSQVGSTLGGATSGVIAAMSFVFGGIISFLLILVISFYLSVQKNGVSNFLHVITPEKYEGYIVDLWKRSQRKIGLWMQGQLFLGFIIGLLTYLGLSILQVENAMTLALLTAVFELIPIFGPILAMIPAVLLGFLQEGYILAAFIFGLYIIIQQFENHLIHPLVVKKIVGIPSLIAILALIIGGTLGGFLGIILAVPVAAAVMEIIGDLEKKKIKHATL